MPANGQELQLSPLLFQLPPLLISELITIVDIQQDLHLDSSTEGGRNRNRKVYDLPAVGSWLFENICSTESRKHEAFSFCNNFLHQGLTLISELKYSQPRLVLLITAASFQQEYQHLCNVFETILNLVVVPLKADWILINVFGDQMISKSHMVCLPGNLYSSTGWYWTNARKWIGQELQLSHFQLPPLLISNLISWCPARRD